MAIGAAVSLLLMGGIIMGTRWRIPRIALKNFRESRAAKQEICLSWTGTNLRLEQPDAYQDRPWTDWKKWAENGTVLVLIGAGPALLPLPKRAFSEAQIGEIRACLTEAGVPKARLLPF